jgi:glutathione S-transferase
MSDWLSITQARDLPGLRLVMIRHLPSPWSQAARGILTWHGVEFTKVERSKTDPEDALLEWTRQNSFPAAMYDDERPRTGWSEILFLAERLASEAGGTSTLIPKDPLARTQMFGIAHELMGEMGLVWAFRLFALSGRLDPKASDPRSAEFARKYHSGGASPELGKRRIIEVLGVLDHLLERSQAEGSPYLVGETVSAADIYWACACNVLAPLPPEQLPILDKMRPIFEATDPDLLAALTDRLRTHRDFIYANHLTLPAEL